MGLETVIQDILERGKRETDAILSQGKAECDAIRQDAQKKIELKREERMKEVEKIIARLRQQEISSAHLDAKKIRLNAQKDLLEEVKVRAFKALSNLPQDKNHAFLKALVGKASRELNIGNIYCNEKDANLVKIMSGHFKFGGTINCIGGVVVESLDKTILLDYRYETILEEIWIDAMKKVSDILFSRLPFG